MNKNPSGATIAEVVTVLGIFAIVITVAATVLYFVNNQFVKSRERFEAESLAARTEFQLRTSLSEAVDVDFTGAAGGNLGGGPGSINNVNINRFSDMPQRWTTVATYLQESGTLIVAGQNTGDLKKTGIFIRRPNNLGPDTTPVLFIKTNRNNGIINADYDDFWADRIAYFRLTKRRHATYDRTTSVDVAFGIRIQGVPERKNWCMTADILAGVNACNVAGAKWIDIDRRFTVLLRNNLIHVANSVGSGIVSEERLLGNLYFFHAYLPSPAIP